MPFTDNPGYLDPTQMGGRYRHKIKGVSPTVQAVKCCCTDRGNTPCPADYAAIDGDADSCPYCPAHGTGDEWL